MDFNKPRDGCPESSNTALEAFEQDHDFLPGRSGQIIEDQEQRLGDRGMT